MIFLNNDYNTGAHPKTAMVKIFTALPQQKKSRRLVSVLRQMYAFWWAAPKPMPL